MNELLFPMATVAGVFLILIPALTLLSKGALVWVRRRTSSWADFGSEVTFAWLVAPSFLPLLWIISSALHQSEPTRSAEFCLNDQAGAFVCQDALWLFGLLAAGMSLTAGARLFRDRPRVALHALGREHELTSKVDAIVTRDPQLRALRFAVVRGSSAPLYTVGLWRPKVVIDSCFVRDMDAEVLHAAMLHEYAHIAGRDTLRNFLVRLSLALNPAGALLKDDFARWHSAREAMCDSEAVHLGGEALALAQGIVCAAKFRCDHPSYAVGLCGQTNAALKLRLTLLLNGPPAPRRTLGHVFLLSFLLFALVSPHSGGSNLLDLFHMEVERILHS